MGPHSFKCGKIQVNRWVNEHLEGLQWGRTLSSAENLRCVTGISEKYRLQWGRTLSSAEKSAPPPLCDWLSKSFNGAALFQVRKTPVNPAVSIEDLVASMGPHSFKCGKVGVLVGWLQWGRTLSSAERAKAHCIVR